MQALLIDIEGWEIQMERLLKQIEAYKPCNEQEEKDRELLIQWIRSGRDIVTRANETAHLTASAWVVSPDRKHVLMAYHNIYNSWAWLGEVPIGCVIVKDGKIIARGYNRRNTDKNTLAHAELQAIRKASKAVGDWRLEECTMYITLEPCQMCAGAIVQARIPRVVIGCRNPKAGCAGSILNLLNVPAFNHQVELTEGILQEECSTLLKEFFRKLRKIKVQKV